MNKFSQYTSAVQINSSGTLGAVWIVIHLAYLLMLRIVGATLVIALVGSRWQNARCRMGVHKGRPYIYRSGPDA